MVGSIEEDNCALLRHPQSTVATKSQTRGVFIDSCRRKEILLDLIRRRIRVSFAGGFVHEPFDSRDLYYGTGKPRLAANSAKPAPDCPPAPASTHGAPKGPAATSNCGAEV